jgi:hypothetical protein
MKRGKVESGVQGKAMTSLPASIRKHAEELRKVRLSQRWSSYSEALEQCRRVEACAAAISGGKSKRSASAPAKTRQIFTVAKFDEIMHKFGAVPLTAAERKKYAKFLKR